MIFSSNDKYLIGRRDVLEFRTPQESDQFLYYPFDVYGQGLDGIAFHKLSAAYSGNLLTLQRLSDNATETFKFLPSQYWISEDSPNAAETTTIGAWALGTNAVIVTHVNQGTKGNYTQSAAANRPMFVVNGQILRDTGGRPHASTYFGSTIRFIQQSPHVTTAQPFTAFGVATTGNPFSGTGEFLWVGNSRGDRKIANKSNTNFHNEHFGTQLNDNNLLTVSQQFVFYSLANGINSAVATDDNTPITGSAGASGITVAPNIGSHSAAILWWTGYYSENLLWAGNMSANNVDIRANLLTLYSTPI